MQGYVHNEDTMDWLNDTGNDVPSGRPVFIGTMVAIATGIILDGKIGVVRLTGVIDMAKTTSLAIVAGDRLFWNTSTNKVTKTVTHKPFGVAALAAASNATTVRVLIGDDAKTAALVAAMTDNSGGVASDTLASIAAGGTYAQADIVAIANALASISAKQNAILVALKAAGLMYGA